MAKRMTTDRSAEERAYIERSARESYDEVIARAAETLRKWADDLERQYNSAQMTGGMAKPIDVGAWAITHLANIAPNLRMDLIAKYAADIHAARQEG